MAIACRLCGKTLQALASGRCRKCRRLVCKECVGTGSFQTAEGFLCRECLAQEPAPTEAPAAKVAAARGNANLKIFWSVALILAAAFAILVAYPYLRAVYWQRALESAEPEKRSAAGRALAELGDGPALRVLREAAENGSASSRQAAVEGLGWCCQPAAEDILRRLAEDKAEPEAVRITAQEALCRHLQLRQAAGPTAEIK